MLLYIFLAALLTDLLPAPEDPSKKEMDAWPEGIGPGGDALTPSLSCTVVFFHGEGFGVKKKHFSKYI